MNTRGQFVQTPYDALTYRIIGCAMTVHRELRPGLRENSYQRAVAAAFETQGRCYEAQKHIEVLDKAQNGRLIGYYIPDFIVEQQVVVEIKALKELENAHIAQVIGYLAVTGCPVGLLINFGERQLRQRRVLPPKNIAEHQPSSRWLFVPDWLKETGP